MAIIDTLRFRNILVDGEIADEEPAQELVTALDETFDEALDGLTTKQDINELRSEMAALRSDMRAMQAEIMQDAAERETRLTSRLYTALGVAVGVVLTALGVAATLLAVFG